MPCGRSIRSRRTPIAQRGHKRVCAVSWLKCQRKLDPLLTFSVQGNNKRHNGNVPCLSSPSPVLYLDEITVDSSLFARVRAAITLEMQGRAYLPGRDTHPQTLSHSFFPSFYFLFFPLLFERQRDWGDFYPCSSAPRIEVGGGGHSPRECLASLLPL
jgi:hypothetical protein